MVPVMQGFWSQKPIWICKWPITPEWLGHTAQAEGGTCIEVAFNIKEITIDA
jgi:hypothetical protein